MTVPRPHPDVYGGGFDWLYPGSPGVPDVPRPNYDFLSDIPPFPPRPPIPDFKPPVPPQPAGMAPSVFLDGFFSGETGSRNLLIAAAVVLAGIGAVVAFR